MDELQGFFREHGVEVGIAFAHEGEEARAADEREALLNPGSGTFVLLVPSMRIWSAMSLKPAANASRPRMGGWPAVRKPTSSALRCSTPSIFPAALLGLPV